MAEYPEVKFSIEEAQGGVWAVFELTTLAVEQIDTPQVTPQVQQLLDSLNGEMTRPETPNSRLQKYRRRASQ